MDAVPIRDEIFATNPRIVAGPSASNAWLWLFAEFFIGLVLSCCLMMIDFAKSMLPKPPRDLRGNVVLVAGATSRFGGSIADEFARNGCTIVCVDGDIKELEKMKSRRLIVRSRMVIEAAEIINPDKPARMDRQIGAENRPSPSSSSSSPPHRCYECNLRDNNCIKKLASRIKDDFGGIDVLVTCTDFGTVEDARDARAVDNINAISMSHYWTTLALLPSLMKRERAHVVDVTPISSTEEARAGSRAAIAGLAENLTRESNGGNERLNFIAVTPRLRDSAHGWPTRAENDDEERRLARDVVQAVRGPDRCTLDENHWYYLPLYRTSCAIHAGITIISRWLHAPGCDNSW